MADADDDDIDAFLYGPSAHTNTTEEIIKQEEPLDHDIEGLQREQQKRDAEKQKLEQEDGGEDDDDEDEEEEEEDDESKENESDEESDLEIVMNDTATTENITKPAAIATHNKTLDLTQPGTTKEGVSTLEIKLDEDETKEWRKPGADPTDFFNYGFDEETWRIYANKQILLREQSGKFDLIGEAAKIRNNDQDLQQVTRTIGVYESDSNTTNYPPSHSRYPPYPPPSSHAPSGGYQQYPPSSSNNNYQNQNAPPYAASNSNQYNSSQNSNNHQGNWQPRPKFHPYQRPPPPRN